MWLIAQLFLVSGFLYVSESFLAICGSFSGSICSHSQSHQNPKCNSAFARDYVNSAWKNWYQHGNKQLVARLETELKSAISRSGRSLTRTRKATSGSTSISYRIVHFKVQYVLNDECRKEILANIERQTKQYQTTTRIHRTTKTRFTHAPTVHLYYHHSNTNATRIAQMSTPVPSKTLQTTKIRYTHATTAHRRHHHSNTNVITTHATKTSTTVPNTYVFPIDGISRMRNQNTTQTRVHTQFGILPTTTVKSHQAVTNLRSSTTIKSTIFGVANSKQANGITTSYNIHVKIPTISGSNTQSGNASNHRSGNETNHHSILPSLPIQYHNSTMGPSMTVSTPSNINRVNTLQHSTAMTSPSPHIKIVTSPSPQRKTLTSQSPQILTMTSSSPHSTTVRSSSPRSMTMTSPSPTCSPMFCVLNCGNPPRYKTDSNGCPRCECAFFG